MRGARGSGPSVAGRTLRERLNAGRIPLHECVSILRDVATSLASLHGDGEVDGGLTPGRIVLSFGDAVISGSGPVSNAADGESVRYRAPEQFRNEPAVAQSDLYAWGVIAYEMVSGAHPFAVQHTAEGMAQSHVGEQPVHLLLSNPGVPQKLATTIMRCLAKEAAQRPASAEVIAGALEDPALGDAHVASNERKERRTDWWHTPAKLFAVLCVIAFSLKDLEVVDRMLGFTEPLVVDSLLIRGDEIRTVTVLPFEVPGNSITPAYLSTALAGEIEHVLAGVQGIRLGGHASAAAYRGAPANSFQAGKALNVDAVVSGFVQRVPSGVRVSVRLGTAQGVALVRDSTDKPIEQLFAIQDALATTLLHALSPGLDRGAVRTLIQEARGTTNVRAYMMYLEARYGVVARDSAGLAKAIELYGTAAALDPRFARARAGVAESQLALAGIGVKTDSLTRLAVMSSARALAADSSSADAQAAVADAMANGLKFSDASVWYARALRAMPGDARLHLRQARNLLATGKIQAAIAETRFSAALDPVSETAAVLHADALSAARSFTESAEAARTYLARDSSSAAAMVALGRAQLFSGEIDAAVTTLESAYQRDSSVRDVRASLLAAYASARRSADVTRLRSAVRRAGDAASAYDALVVAITSGDKEGALALLEKSVQRATDLSDGSRSIGCDPMLDALHGEGRYLIVLSELGVTPCGITKPFLIIPPRRTAPAPASP